jgi:hypothetical protein
MPTWPVNLPFLAAPSFTRRSFRSSAGACSAREPNGRAAFPATQLTVLHEVEQGHLQLGKRGCKLRLSGRRVRLPLAGHYAVRHLSIAWRIVEVKDEVKIEFDIVPVREEKRSCRVRKMQSTTTNTAAFPSPRLRSQQPIPASALTPKAFRNWPLMCPGT